MRTVLVKEYEWKKRMQGPNVVDFLNSLNPVEISSALREFEINS